MTQIIFVRKKTARRVVLVNAGGSYFTTATFSAPADIQAGDILALFDRSDNNSGTPSNTIPSGFSQLQTNSATQRRSSINYKLAVGTEGGASLTGQSGTASTRKLFLVLRPNFLVTTLTPGGAVGSITNGAVSSQNIAASGGAAPLLVLAGYGASSLAGSGITSSPAFDETIYGTEDVAAEYKFYLTSPQDHSVALSDNGFGNCAQGGYLELS